MSQHAMHTDPHAPHLRVDYVDADGLSQWLAQPDVLAVFGFGPGAPGADDPRYLRVPLAPFGDAPLEVWRGHGAERAGGRWRSDASGGRARSHR